MITILKTFPLVSSCSRLSPWEQCYGWPLHYRCLPHRSERLAAHWWPSGEDHQSAPGGEADCRAHRLPAVLPSRGPAVETTPARHEPARAHVHSNTRLHADTHTHMQSHTYPRVSTRTLPNFTTVLPPSILLFQRASFSDFFVYSVCLFVWGRRGKRKRRI